MRLIKQFDNLNKARAFSNYLSKADLQHSLDISKNEIGLTAQIWIIDEEDLPKAQQHFETFSQLPNYEEYLKETSSKRVSIPKQSLKPAKPAKPFTIKIRPTRLPTIGQCKLTLTIVIVCILTFLSQSVNDIISKSEKTPDLIYSNPVNRNLLIDYPKKIDYFLKIFLTNPTLLSDSTKASAEEQILLKNLSQIPYWKGVYFHLLSSFKEKQSTDKYNILNEISKEPFLEQVKEGEVWRLFTPCLLHGSLLHILFNLLWIIILGKQIENNIGPFRFLCLVLITGCFSNLCQYTMTGPAFLGISGVVTALIGFVWQRQRLCPWEGYSLHSSTFMVIGFFLLLPLVIQVASFYTEIYTQESLSVSNIANTAHFAGLLIGCLLGKSSLFRAGRQNSC
jgi:GlpG protein